MRILRFVLLATVALAGCGKMGPPQPAGSPDKVIWPRGYPTPGPDDAAETPPVPARTPVR